MNNKVIIRGSTNPWILLMDNTGFNNKTVIITGASAGVGAECARQFANNGANLVLVARGEAALAKIAEELRAVTEVLTIAMDVSDTAACKKLLETANEKFGSVDVIVNNAGIHFRGTVDSRDADYFAMMVDVNLRAPIVLATAAIPYLRKSQGGAILMVGSLAGRSPLMGSATYSSTKAGLRAFTHALAEELEDSPIKVGLISPGPINTGFIMDHINDVDDIVYSQKMSSAEEVAVAILELASSDKVEVCIPAMAGKMTSLMYLFPKLRKFVRPILRKKGRKNKQKYLQ
jgi:hypothetical protein